MSRITVISCGIDEELPESTINIIQNADCVAGGKKLLEQFSVPDEKQRPVTAHAKKEITNLVSEVASGKEAVVLGSGDTLFHGIGGTVKRAVGDQGIVVQFIPAPTAFQHLCAREGIVWNQIKHFSIHGGGAIPAREILSSGLAVVYCGSITASELAKVLIGIFPGSVNRPAILADSLNSDSEKIFYGTLQELSLETVSPTSMLLLKEPTYSIQQPLLTLGTSNEDFLHEANLITAEEVRAVVLAKLRLPVSGVMWDIGAGSGSVGIEAAGICPGIEVHSVEQKTSRAEMILENCRSFGLANVTVHEGSAVELIRSLPSPERIFVGGGGKDIVQILEHSFERLRSGGIMVVSAVTLETIMNVYSWNCNGVRESLTIDIAKEESLGVSGYHMYRSNNRITLFVFRKDKNEK